MTEHHNETMLVDGMTEALLGYARVFNKYVAVYDKVEVINILMRRDGMSYEEAIDFFEYNIVGAYVGDGTPAFLETGDITYE